MSRTANSPQNESYNERLFSGKGLRSYLHNSRFMWFQNTLIRLGIGEVNVVEIGCFDGRLLNFFPVEPRTYLGLDAGWEGGLTEAQEKYKNNRCWRFEQAVDAGALNRIPDNTFEIGAAMETIEHISPDLVDDYLAELARVVNGHILITVPNEKGIVFLAKWIIKKVFLGSAEQYTFAELLSATFGRMKKVVRNEHKGFDYEELERQVSKHFQVICVEGIPFGFAPKCLSFTIGILARNRGVA